MKNEIKTSTIQSSIYNIRGKQVMLDSTLAEMYQVSTGRLNEQVKRNIERFPEDFMFQLTKNEWENLKSHFAISSWGGRRKLPYVFTEQGIATLSGVLKSEVAIHVNIIIMRTFVQMRKFISTNATIFQRLDKVEQKQLETDKKFAQVFKALDNANLPPNQGIFFNGQIFDAYVFVNDLIKTAKQSIVLIDNYIDDTVLMMLSKRNQNVIATIYTTKISEQLKLDLQKHNQQYTKIDVKKCLKSHDRFLIIDEKDIYHIGASLKDLGKKVFAFSKIETEIIGFTAKEILKRII